MLRYVKEGKLLMIEDDDGNLEIVNSNFKEKPKKEVVVENNISIDVSYSIKTSSFIAWVSVFEIKIDLL